MKTEWNPRSGKFCIRTFLCTASWLAFAIASAGQVGPASPESGAAKQEKPKQDITFRVAVDEVIIDAVVVDKKGRQVTDLTADDFEIYQDGKAQKVASAAYVDNYQPQNIKSASRDSKKLAPLISTPMLAKEKVRRAMVFVVDDLSMGFEHLHYARMALEKFVETQMQPGDLIAILRTGSGGALQQFSSDKRMLLYIINDMRWGMFNCGPSG